jgi:hypothetical protein
MSRVCGVVPNILIDQGLMIVRSKTYRMDRASDLDRNDAEQEVRLLLGGVSVMIPRRGPPIVNGTAVSPLLPPVAGGDTPRMYPVHYE